MNESPSPSRFGRVVNAVQYLVGVAAATTVVLLFTLGDDPEADSRSYSSPEIALGGQIYASECAICHGPDRQGGTGPALGADLLDRYPDGSAMELIVARGVNAMIGFESRLTPQQIEAVVAFTLDAASSGG